MKPFAAVVLALTLTGCGTRLYAPNGKCLVSTYGDIEGLEYRGPGGVYLRAASINHSKPTQTALTGATSAVTAAGAALMGM